MAEYVPLIGHIRRRMGRGQASQARRECERKAAHRIGSALALPFFLDHP